MKIGSVFDYFATETFFFPVENDLFLRGKFPDMDLLDSVVDFLQEFVYHNFVLAIQGNFILSSLISLSSSSDMNSLQLTVATKSPVIMFFFFLKKQTNKHFNNFV